MLFTKLRLSRPLLFVAVAAAVTSQAHAQWTYQVLHPAGAVSSRAGAGGAGGQAGTVQPTSGVNHAAAWSGTAASFVDLHVAGFAHSSCFGGDGNVQVGAVETAGGSYYASMWSGTPGSYVDLNPAGAIASNAVSVSGGKQGGFAVFGSLARPGTWSGTAGSFVDLTPAGFNGNGAVTDVDGGLAVGQVQKNGVYSAGLWTGSAASWVELATNAFAYGTDGVQQVGALLIGGSSLHACVWSGSGASVVDLAPPGSTTSYANDVDGGRQVGGVSFGFQPVRAHLWSGSAASAEDLHAVLPSTYVDSTAEDIWHVNGTTYVLGTATVAATSATEVVLWRRLDVTAYCTAKANSLGCTPTISFTGSPSAAGSHAFSIRATNLRNGLPGLLLYSAAGRATLPFGGGTLCVSGPLHRSPSLSTGGNPPPAADCSGVLLMDMNAFRAGQLGGNPRAFLSVPGVVVDAQYWARDPGFPAPNNVQLSNAIEFELGN